MTTHTPIKLYLHYPTFLPDFSIGDKQTPPAVAISELQYHLRILGSFAKLRDGVKTTAVVVGDRE